MTTELNPTDQHHHKHGAKSGGGSAGAVYGLGLIGAWIYYIGRARTVQEGALGFLKGMVWPVFVVYRLLEFLDMEKPD